ncbi:MAG: hypothetical protein M1831_004595 [Alyxoria varia]|nr:MAG: hypothetical protein M1831_004595 [Alyxoria varia]
MHLLGSSSSSLLLLSLTLQDSLLVSAAPQGRTNNLQRRDFFQDVSKPFVDAGKSVGFGTSEYVPVKAETCPMPISSVVRKASAGLSQSETDYVTKRKLKSDAALGAWLKRIGKGFDTLKPEKYPTLALVTSGGGFRAALTGMGVRKALDGAEVDTKSSLAGLLQAMTYESALSGGGWLLGSLASHNWPTITTLLASGVKENLDSGLVNPADGKLPPIADYWRIVDDLKDKKKAGWDVGIVDVYARLLGYLWLMGKDGGRTEHLSTLPASQSLFQSNDVPLPIWTAIGVDSNSGKCQANIPEDSPQFEFTPFDFGSWDASVSAFASQNALGSTKNDQNTEVCATGFDNLGFVMGTSADVFNVAVCGDAASTSPGGASPGDEDAAAKFLTGAKGVLKDVGFTDSISDATYALYPNPWRGQDVASAESLYKLNEAKNVALVDGGETQQNNPIWPFIQPARAVDVLFVNDNSADTAESFPNGTAIRATYLASQAAGLDKMPEIPEPQTFVDKGFDKRPRIFGCNDPAKTMIVYVPNANYVFDSGLGTFTLQVPPETTDSMVQNGEQVALGGAPEKSAEWGTCVACAVMNKSGVDLPPDCDECLKTWCEN